LFVLNQESKLIWQVLTDSGNADIQSKAQRQQVIAAFITVAMAVKVKSGDDA